MNYDNRQLYLNEILYSLLGSQNLIDKWWNSKNKAFNMNTPIEQYSLNEESVVKYIVGQLNSDYY